LTGAIGTVDTATREALQNAGQRFKVAVQLPARL
jgi:hypothetical protein